MPSLGPTEIVIILIVVGFLVSVVVGGVLLLAALLRRSGSSGRADQSRTADLEARVRRLEDRP